MALPGNFNTVVVQGTYLNLDGSQVVGKVTFRAQTVLVDPSADTTIVPISIDANLVAGHFSVALPATDDPDISPSDWVYVVTESWAGGRTFSMQVPIAMAGTGIDMSDVAPVEAPDETTPNTQLWAGVGVPTGGTTGQVLKKNSNADYDTVWGAGGSGGPTLPLGGTAGQILQKESSTDGDATWHTKSVSAAQISDGTTVGRNVLTAADAAAARTAIGAGTSSFDGDYGSLANRPTLGTASTHAATDFDTAGAAAAVAAGLGSVASHAFSEFDLAGAAAAVAAFDNTGTDLSSTTVQNALEELDAARATDIAEAVLEARSGILLATDADLLAFRGDVLPGSEVTMLRKEISGNFNLTSGVLQLSYFTAIQDRAGIDNLCVITAGTAGSGGTVTIGKLGLFSVDGSGNLTLMAASTNDTTMFGAASTVYDKAITAQSLTKGSRYAIGVLQVGYTTAPKIYGCVTVGVVFGRTPVKAMQLSGQTDMPSTIAVGSLATTTGLAYAEAHP